MNQSETLQHVLSLPVETPVTAVVADGVLAVPETVEIGVAVDTVTQTNINHGNNVHRISRFGFIN